MKILIVGTWRKKDASKYKKVAGEVGKFLAEKNVELVSGAGEGISELVVNSYKKNNGKKYTAYLPSKKEMEKVGEKIGPKPDKIINTNLDYPERNVRMVRECSGVIALNGGLGALTEIIHAVKDYNKKVAVLNYGEISKWCKKIPQLEKEVFITKNIKKAFDYLK